MSYQIPRGCQDILPEQSYAWQSLERTLREFCYLYNYDEIRTPIFEHTNVFKRENDSSDMVNKEMYTFKLENSKTSLTIRPEGTAGVVRSFVENKMYANPDLPVKLYYMGPMARHERPQKGRLRIFNQFGVECLGNKSPYTDVETIALAFSILKALGLQDLKVCLNTLGDDDSRANYRQALKDYFAPYKEELCSDCKRRYEQNPLRILDCKVDKDKECMKHVPKMKDYLNEESKSYFDTVCSLLDELEIPYEIDDQLVRGLDYYTHTVFEIVSLNKEMGAQSTVLAGGRYDGLIPYFGGPEAMSGIGWALGMERLLIALEAEGIELGQKPDLDVFVMCLDEEARTYAFKALTELRAYGYRCEMDMLGRGFKGQFKAADRSHAQFALLLGNKEAQDQTITIKNLKEKTQETIAREALIGYVDAHMEEEHEHHHQEEEE
ncbi:histidine--tRNA ligase [Faecalicoccus pleomorphus]|uniref:histidine--tRNA ligase n=1 Tax=Faecalicoccus pleomorphus TaxID=1323 RepID=UPI00232C0D4E|nr:histidine--tRNA ligase [Faecalicoccus pleomorphus]MDB7987898.1 histidine--tRNA ligase [Faecalicoccus pleomorphus]MDB7992557.1 histidine--tRNA ligase [Faecalicoccus pleomorphus]